MGKEKLTLYSKDLNTDELKGNFETILSGFSNGYGILECFGENLFQKLSEIENLQDRVDDLISARFFDAPKQVKCRRLKDGMFRLVSDQFIQGWNEQTFDAASCIHCQIALWGYRNPKLGKFMYEERIPRLFDYPMEKDAIDALNEQEKILLEEIAKEPCKKVEGEDILIEDQRRKVLRAAVNVQEYVDKQGRVFWDRFICLQGWKGEHD